MYVDDFKMAGPQKNLAQEWSTLRARLKIPGHAKDDEKITKSNLPHVSVGPPGDGITYVNDDGKAEHFASRRFGIAWSP